MDGPLKWHGGKGPLAKKIVGLFPPRCKNPNNPSPDDTGYLHYVEPYFGGGSVMLANDPEGISEVANDLNGLLTNFWAVLADPDLFPKFRRQVEATPFDERIFRRAAEFVDGDKVEEGHCSVYRAVQFFIVCRQSLSGRMKGFAGITRNRTRRGMNEQVSAWLNSIEGLPIVHGRMKRALVRNQPAVTVIKKEDGKRSLFYVDPPYLFETRETTGEYEHEMSDDQHLELLDVLSRIQGRFILSGYRSKMYDEAAEKNNWRRHEFNVPNNSAGGKKKRRMVECCWLNYDCNIAAPK